MSSASAATQAVFLGMSSNAAGFAQARSVVWETSPMAHTAGAIDVRLFRIGTANTANGLSVTN